MYILIHAVVGPDTQYCGKLVRDSVLIARGRAGDHVARGQKVVKTRRAVVANPRLGFVDDGMYVTWFQKPQQLSTLGINAAAIKVHEGYGNPEALERLVRHPRMLKLVQRPDRLDNEVGRHSGLARSRLGAAG